MGGSIPPLHRFMVPPRSRRRNHSDYRPERLLDRDGELLQRERLRQEVEVLALRQVLAEGVLGIAGDEDDLQVRPRLAQLAEQRRPVELGHHHVGDDEVDLAAGLLHHLERLDAGGRLVDLVAARGERARGEGAHRLLVLDEQDRRACR